MISFGKDEGNPNSKDNANYRPCGRRSRRQPPMRARQQFVLEPEPTEGCTPWRWRLTGCCFHAAYVYCKTTPWRRLGCIGQTYRGELYDGYTRHGVTGDRRPCCKWQGAPTSSSPPRTQFPQHTKQYVSLQSTQSLRSNFIFCNQTWLAFLLLIREVLILILTRRPALLTRGFSCFFSQPNRTNAVIVL
jgi:hypothetical protein